MNMRVNQMVNSAQVVAEFLDSHPKIELVRYPGLKSHPGHELAMKQMSGKGGSMIGFQVKGGKEAAFDLLNKCSIIEISNNLGDSKSLMTHPASSTHRRLAPEVQAEMGIHAGTLRLSVGLEAATDLVKDLERALR
jgi:O-succinylhomoserine sulfhydrylase